MSDRQPVSIITDQDRAIQAAISEGELYNFINLTETTEEFESSWNSILDKYELRSNDWLQSLCIARDQWFQHTSAANLYTRKIVLKFQEELVETFVYTANIIEEDDINSTFKVAKFKDVDRAYTAAFNHAELRANGVSNMRYSNLCREAVRYAEEDAVTVETYNAAVTGLKEGAKKLLQ
ncbi:hypothetical protein KIW84_013070 [Lathyrus oleraceus]|uniref:Protein FAR1-RELATED SEQUENCE n=1 Tax=Pisum sativum TaxID=3888 RepID=A0A9D5BJ58_PEA|nr:hypothetical protein KIW84_013070 [Pisum sativum]